MSDNQFPSQPSNNGGMPPLPPIPNNGGNFGGNVPPTYNAPQAPFGAPQNNKKTNTLAIVSLISSFFISLVGIITGHMALSQIKKTGEKGRGMALAGTIIGYVGFVGSIIGLIFMMQIAGLAASSDISSLESGSSSISNGTSSSSKSDSNGGSNLELELAGCDDIVSYSQELSSASDYDSQKAVLDDMVMYFDENYAGTEIGGYISDMGSALEKNDLKGATSAITDASIYCTSIL